MLWDNLWKKLFNNNNVHLKRKENHFEKLKYNAWHFKSHQQKLPLLMNEGEW